MKLKNAKKQSNSKGEIMPLSCSCDCDGWEAEFGMWMYWGGSEDFEKLDSKKRKRCKSCNELIELDSFCVKHPRLRYPRNEIEARILGMSEDEYEWEEPDIKIADHFHCEKCGEIYLNLQSVGFECISPGENMPQMLKDYQVEYAPPKIQLTKV